MKSTGITRRIDDLGRIVIPKEIRKNLKIKENEILEIFIENESIILKKYSSFDDISNLLDKFINVLKEITSSNVLITNRDKVINVSENKKNDYLNKELSDEIITYILNREQKLSNSLEPIELIINKEIKTNYYLKIIINDGDILGSIIIFKDKKIDEKDIYSVEIISKLIVNYLG